MILIGKLQSGTQKVTQSRMSSAYGKYIVSTFRMTYKHDAIGTRKNTEKHGFNGF